MGGRTKRSKRQSVGSPGQSQPDPFVLFLDEGIHNCRPIHLALREMDVVHQRHGERFSAGIEDTKWLPEVGKEKWALLTADKRIRYNQLERDKIVQYGIREFVFTSGNLSGAMMGEILKVAIPRMRKLFAEVPPPFIACISQSGNVEVRFNKYGSLHDREKRKPEKKSD